MTPMEHVRREVDGRRGGAVDKSGRKLAEDEYAVIGNWLAVKAEGCTCAGGTVESNGLHEGNCGYEPVATIADLEAVYAKRGAELVRLRAQVSALSAARDRVLAECDELDGPRGRALACETVIETGRLRQLLAIEVRDA